ALITTADFITPPVNDPYTFGQISAANSISDVYAMGGRPLTCLNLAMFPAKKLEPEVLHQIVAGALSKITESGAVLAGGHTIEDDEPKFGLAVTGIVHPRKYWSNRGARPGDVIILTKPIGSGVIFNANIKKLVSDQAMKECIDSLTTLNRKAAEAGFEVHAATDITGFGLAGHCYEMVKGSQVAMEFTMHRIPVMKEALEMYKKGVTTGVNNFNRELVAGAIRFEKDLPPWHKEIVYDPQTSGGLLLSVPASQGEALLKALETAGVRWASLVGEVKPLRDNAHLIFK
ncbi:MAG: selenide, water dikinase SelD, partial [Desulfobacterota bacterium]|nr:selenide, water dikinase SelD [Thermodesulfobacteriota bacterium]